MSDRGTCVGLITHPEESYRVWSVWICNREASITRRPWSTRDGRAIGKNKVKKSKERDQLCHLGLHFQLKHKLSGKIYKVSGFHFIESIIQNAQKKSKQFYERQAIHGHATYIDGKIFSGIRDVKT
jgi:hypothetical protein